MEAMLGRLLSFTIAVLAFTLPSWSSDAQTSAPIGKPNARARLAAGTRAAETTTGSLQQAQPPAAMLTTQALDRMILPDNAGKSSDTVSIIYNSSRRSMIEPCSCIAHKLGGIDREARIIERVHELGYPSLKIDAGGFVRQNPNPNLRLSTQYLLEALGEIGYDAINVGYADMGIGLEVLREFQTSYSLPLISANIVDTTSAPLFSPYRVVAARLSADKEIRIGILGVTAEPNPRKPVKKATVGQARADTTTQVAYRITNPVEAVRRYLPELQQKADILMLLDYQTREAAPDLLRELGKDTGLCIAVIGEFTPGKQVTYYKNNAQDVGNVKLVCGGYEGRQVGHLMIQIRDGKPVRYANKFIEIEQPIPPVPRISKYLEQYRQTIHTRPSAIAPPPIGK